MASTGGQSIIVQVDSGLRAPAYSHLSVVATDWGQKMTILGQYSQYNEAVGAPIELLPEYSFCPVLTGQDRKPVFLFQFIEVLDGLIDYQEVKKQLPGLSFRQIGGAIAFLRKLTQFNFKGIDIDAFIDSEESIDQELQDNLRSALSVREASIVLSIP